MRGCRRVSQRKVELPKHFVLVVLMNRAMVGGLEVNLSQGDGVLKIAVKVATEKMYRGSSWSRAAKELLKEGVTCQKLSTLRRLL